MMRKANHYTIRLFARMKDGNVWEYAERAKPLREKEYAVNTYKQTRP
jgi:hypothetical protein